MPDCVFCLRNPQGGLRGGLRLWQVRGTEEAGLGLGWGPQGPGVGSGLHVNTVEVLGYLNAASIQQELGQEEPLCA